MTTQLNVEQLYEGLRSLASYQPSCKEIKNYNKLREILLMISLNSIDYSAFDIEDAKQLNVFYYNEDEEALEALETDLPASSFILKTLKDLPPGGKRNVRFF